ncbi:MAG: hypothetical protein HRU20_16980 [Pseudomonadales bacterium]|nr:hypothetical protein [Pseudomonadales bacterium]
MNGLWAPQLYLHNGSVDSLEALFCLSVTRPTITQQVFSDKGHMMTCDNSDISNPTGITDSEKSQMMVYLRTL